MSTTESDTIESLRMELRNKDASWHHLRRENDALRERLKQYRRCGSNDPQSIGSWREPSDGHVLDAFSKIRPGPSRVSAGGNIRIEGCYLYSYELIIGKMVRPFQPIAGGPRISALLMTTWKTRTTMRHIGDARRVLLAKGVPVVHTILSPTEHAEPEAHLRALIAVHDAVIDSAKSVRKSHVALRVKGNIEAAADNINRLCAVFGLKRPKLRTWKDNERLLSLVTSGVIKGEVDRDA